MFFKRKGVLSDQDVRKLLGRDIFIYPYSEDNLKGSTYNLTASICAFIMDKDDEGKSIKKLLIDNDNRIVIPKSKTALIQTQESMYVTNKICGTYHSRVSLVNKGLSHIGTTLDPGYFGTSVIALHNHSDDDVKIKVGEPIVSLMFYTLRSKSQNFHDNYPFRNDLFDLEITEFYNEIWQESLQNKCEYCSIEKNMKCKQNKCGLQDKCDILRKLDDWKSATFRTNRNELIKEVKKYVEQRDLDKNISLVSILAFVISFILIAIVWIITFIKESSTQSDLLTIAGTLILPLILAVKAWIEEKIRRK